MTDHNIDNTMTRQVIGNTTRMYDSVMHDNDNVIGHYNIIIDNVILK